MGIWEDCPHARTVIDLYDDSSQPTAVVDEELRIVWTNKRALALYGSFKVPDGLSSMLSAEDRHRVGEELCADRSVTVSTGRLPLGTTELFFVPFCTFGGTRFALVHLSPANAQGTALDPLGANRVVSTFSNQLRGPLSSIFASLSAMSRMEELKKERSLREHLLHINQNSYKILRHCVNLTEYTRFTSAINPFEPVTVDLRELLRQLGDAVQMLAQDLGIPLHVSLPERPLLCQCDQEKLQNALLNVLSNSLRYTRSDNEITLALEEVSGSARITVTDRGLGIEPEIYPYICDPFFSHDPTGYEAAGGGLGLTVAKLSMAAHGGTLMIDSVEGSGTKVVLTLPLRQKQEGFSGEGVLRAPNSADYICDRFSPVHILLADVCRTPEP
ncbi:MULTISPECIES: PAS domain-containing sensor histidine kinase [Oscillospiraceae]|uniref:histidine kinase n=1 Tax=Harryflintia acetispora TaxID=1849041 RepID=A0A9X8UHU2_9FIRM|nr:MULTISPECIES: PAS domain-containing sensor histidine kinase [Oscillospiraceae]TCL42607.1 histidine kinase/DNA gyrase B/HSP90-like ATPase [Harryflintia acetispora]